MSDGFKKGLEGLDQGAGASPGEAPPSPDQPDQLQALIELLAAEAAGIPNGVPAVWHPDVTADLVRAATDRPVVEVRAGDAAGAVAAWEAATAVPTATTGASPQPE